MGAARKEFTYLPSSFDAVEITVEGASQNPHLCQAEFARNFHIWAPHIHGCTRSIVHCRRA